MKTKMNIIDNYITDFNHQLSIISSQQDVQLGLFEGKTGWAIYFYEMSRLIGDENLEYIAVRLINEICIKAQSVNSMDLRNGIAGIGLGISYLFREKFIVGDINKILSDIDDKLFKELSSTTLYRNTDLHSVVHMIFYIIDRLERLKNNSENEYLFKELLIYSINELYDNLKKNHLEEPLFYSLEFLLPQLLFLFSKILRLNFYNNRVMKIIGEMTYFIFSFLPRLNSHRLYLLWAIDTLNKEFYDNKDWEKYKKLLYGQIDINEIFNHELHSYNIFFNEGYPSIYIFLLRLRRYFTNENLFQCRRLLLDKVINSQSRNDLIANNGLYNGYCGTYLTLKKF